VDGATPDARRVLVVGRTADNGRIIEEVVRSWMLETVACTSLQESREILAQEDFALVFCEDRFDGGVYADVLAAIRDRSKVPFVVMVSEATQDFDLGKARELGALDVLPSPCSRRDVQWMVIRATQVGRGSRSLR